MSADIIVAVLSTAGFSAVIGSVVTGLFSKKKLGAEATEIITKAAASVVTDLRGEVDRQKAVNADLVAEHRATIKTLMESHAEELEEVRRVLQLHVAWDAIAIAKMAEVGIDLPPAPPLLPARRFDHPTGS